MTSHPEPIRPNDSPIAKLWEGLVRDCIKRNGSAMHLDPQAGHDPIIRAQIQGEWQVLMTCPVNAYPALVQRLRVIAGIDLIRQTPVQRGAVRAVVDDVPHDVTVTIQATTGPLEEAFLRFGAPPSTTEGAAT